MENPKKIKCADCNKNLMNYWIHSPDVQEVKTVICNCPFCGGSSFKVDICGKFWYGPIGKDESSNPTTVLNIDYNDKENLFTVEVIKNENK